MEIVAVWFQFVTWSTMQMIQIVIGLLRAVFESGPIEIFLPVKDGIFIFQILIKIFKNVKIILNI